MGGANQINLNWTAPPDTAGVNVAGYDVYRQNPDGQTWRRLNDQPALLGVKAALALLGVNAVALLGNGLVVARAQRERWREVFAKRPDADPYPRRVDAGQDLPAKRAAFAAAVG